MQMIRVTDDLVLEVWRSFCEGDHALVKLRSRDIEADGENTPGVVVIWTEEIRPLVEALARAEGMLAEEVATEAALYEGDFRGKVTRRYVMQLLGDDTDGWEDTAYCDDPDRAARMARLEVATNPHVRAGRVIDGETGQVVVDVPEGG